MQTDEQEDMVKKQLRFINGGLKRNPQHLSRVKIIQRKIKNARRNGIRINPFTNLSRRTGVFCALVVLILSSCTKEWNCTTEVHTQDFYGNEYVIETETTFHGTTAEKNDLEATSTPDKTIECH